jgi:hypothetical protein
MKILLLVSLGSLAVLILVVYSQSVSIYYQHRRVQQVWPFTRLEEVLDRFAVEQQIPRTHGLLQGYNGRFLTQRVSLPSEQRIWDFNHGTRWELAARPIVGDHIHMDVSFWIRGQPKQVAEHDRNFVEHEHYENKSEICTTPGNIAYSKLWPHAGVHTHCDGLIHVHPWSAPHVIRKEGLDITLGLWFDQIGVRYWENSLKFSDGLRLTNNATHQWRVAEWVCYGNGEPPTIYTQHLDQIWLGHAYGSYVIWYGHSSQPPPPIPSHHRQLQQVGAHGFNQLPYPQHCFTKTRI